MSLFPLIILQWNAQSIIAHGNELKHYIYNSNDKPHFVYIQESWLKNSLNYKLCNYFLERKDRFNERRGGVCIFIKNNIVYKIKEHDFINNTEYIHIEFFMNNKYFNLVNPGGKINRDEFSVENDTLGSDHFIIRIEFTKKEK